MEPAAPQWVVQQIVCKLSSELDVSDSFPSGDGA
jgi:hypothetical protein